MTPAEALHKSYEICRSVKKDPEQLGVHNFLHYAELVRDIVTQEWTANQRASRPWLGEWATAFRKLYDDFEVLVKRDPMMLYRPKNRASVEFHQSGAFIRYFSGGNRTSKTQSGYAEHYFFTTHQHPYRKLPHGKQTTFIIPGMSFRDYLPKTFEKKMFLGEEDNPLSPMFPEGGKWFHHYNPREHTVTIACVECAEKGTAGSCKSYHNQSQIYLLSPENGIGVVEGFAARLAHIDEHVEEPFFHAIKQRLGSAKGSSFIITGTPLAGVAAWENQLLRNFVRDAPPETNRSYISDPNSPPLVTVHTISQYDAGIMTPDEIERSKIGMNKFEIRARIYGEPAPNTQYPVFDGEFLEKLVVQTPVRGELGLVVKAGQEEPSVLTIDSPDDVEFLNSGTGKLRVWEQPLINAQYIIGADSAAGLISHGDVHKRDPSCASVIKLEPQPNGNMKMSLVAQYHNWINPFDYAEELKKLGTWYNNALIVIELTGGHGQAVMLKLRKELFYVNLFLDTSAPASTVPGLAGRLGVDTNQYSKPMMIGAMQHVINKQLVTIPCKDTIDELVGYEQVRLPAGGTRYQGSGGAHDDRVMSMVIAVYVALTYPIYKFMQETSQPTKFSSEWEEVLAELKRQEDGSPFHD